MSWLRFIPNGLDGVVVEAMVASWAGPLGADSVGQAPPDLSRGCLRGGELRWAETAGLCQSGSAANARFRPGDRPAPALGRDESRISLGC